MADELEEISRVKPKVWLPEGQRRGAGGRLQVQVRSRPIPFNDDDFAAISQAFDAATHQVTIADRGHVITHYLRFRPAFNHETNTVFIL